MVIVFYVQTELHSFWTHHAISFEIPKYETRCLRTCAMLQSRLKNRDHTSTKNDQEETVHVLESSQWSNGNDTPQRIRLYRQLFSVSPIIRSTVACRRLFLLRRFFLSAFFFHPPSGIISHYVRLDQRFCLQTEKFPKLSPVRVKPW